MNSTNEVYNVAHLTNNMGCQNDGKTELKTSQRKCPTHYYDESLFGNIIHSAFTFILIRHIFYELLFQRSYATWLLFILYRYISTHSFCLFHEFLIRQTFCQMTFKTLNVISCLLDRVLISLLQVIIILSYC